MVTDNYSIEIKPHKYLLESFQSRENIFTLFLKKEKKGDFCRFFGKNNPPNFKKLEN